MSSNRAAQIPVKIQIKTIINYNQTLGEQNESETYELIVFGRYQATPTAKYLRYEEAMEQGDVSTTVKISEKETLLLRNGALKMRMVFQTGIPVSGTYHTPHGIMEIITEAKSIEHAHHDETNEGFITIKYDLFMQATLAGTYKLEIKYKEEQK